MKIAIKTKFRMKNAIYGFKCQKGELKLQTGVTKAVLKAIL